MAEYVNPDDYLPTIGETRAAKSTRDATPVTIDGKQGMLVRKVFDSGRYQYGGPLRGLWVDLIAEENFQMVIDDPLSLVGFTQSSAMLERPETGFRARSETSTHMWGETTTPAARVPLPCDGAGLYGGPRNRPTLRRKDGDRRNPALLDLTGLAGWISLEALAS